MANDAFVVHGMVMLKPQVPTEKVGETMFWKRKKDGAEEEILAHFAVLKTNLTQQHAYSAITT